MVTNYKGVQIEIPNKFLKYHAGQFTLPQRLERGSYEQHEISMLQELVNDNSVILELGGSVGVLSCVTNNMMKNPKNHVVVEAHPHLIPVLEKNKNINECQFIIHHGVASHNEEKINFNYNEYPLNGNTFYLGKFGEGDTIEFDGTTPQFLEEKYGLKFNTLSCDIEGGEFKLLDGLYNYFKNFDVMVVEFHNWGGGEPKRKQLENKYSKHFTITRKDSVTKFVKK